MYPWLLIFGVVLWASVMAWYVRRPIASAFHPISFYLLFHGVIFVIRPVLAWWLGYGKLYAFYQFAPTWAEKATVLLGADLGFITFVLVCARVGNLPFTRASRSERGEPPRLGPSLWLTVALCTPVAILSLHADLQAHAAGISSMIMINGVQVNTVGNGYFTDVQLMLGPLAVLVFWAGRMRIWAAAPLILFVVFRAATGGRWPFVMAIMTALMIFMYEQRRRWPPPRVIGAVAALAILFVVIGNDRGAGLRQLVLGVAPQRSYDYYPERPLESMDFANLEFFEYLVHVVPKRTGTHDYFLSNLQLFTEPVPRVMWPGKPIGAPIQLYSLFDYGNPIGMTFSLPGAGWVEAGWLGIVLWSALFGWGFGRAYAAYVRSDQDRYKTATYMILLPFSIQVFRDGSILFMVKELAFPLLLVLIWRALRRFDGPAVARPAPLAATV